MADVIFISNRLPITIQKNEKELAFNKSIGGLATGLKGYHEEQDSVWIGYPGLPKETLQKEEQLEIQKTLIETYKSVPVFLTQEDVSLYYEGFSNKTIWPLFHYFKEKTEHNRSTWESYQRVNQAFFDVLKDHISEDSTVWVHDYQLMLLPHLIKEAYPNVKIGFFLHIPFPSYELFRLLIWQKEILHGLLGSDLIGFHTYDYVRHFLSSVRRVLGISHALYRLPYEGREVHVDAFPMGIDYAFFAQAKPSLPAVKERVILSVDRLDYTKGIVERLKAFRTFLRRYPQHHMKVKLHLIVAPSRDTLDTYETLKHQIEVLVSEINGEFGSFSWMPVWFLYQSFQQEALIGYYQTSEVMLVTPLRDGMNLIAKEYLASQPSNPGVLIISETAGAASELSEALIVNPNDDEMIASAIHEALTMTVDEKKQRHQVMLKRIKRYDVHFWAKTFIERLTSIDPHPAIQKRIRKLNLQEAVTAYQEAEHRLILLDYDGTLSPLKPLPHQAKPTAYLKKLLNQLAEEAQTDVAIISGRDYQTLDSWLGSLPIALVGDHGVWLKEVGGTWRQTIPEDTAWIKTLHPIVERFSDQMPGSFVEDKTHSFAFHYRRSEPDMVHIKLPELKEALRSIIGDQPIEIQEGHSVLEIKDRRATKGQASLALSRLKAYDFVMIVGDDTTDESMFEVHPEALTIKIGYGETHAKTRLPSPRHLHELLERMVKG